MNKKELVIQYRPLVSLACSLHNCLNAFRIKKKGSGNKISAPCTLLKKGNIRISGNNNTVIIEDFSILNRASITIYGNGNTITIGKWCTLTETEFYIEDDGNTITIGEHTRILGKTHLAAIEGTQIQIGKDCLFSSGIHFRTGDSHSVLDLDGRRINRSEDIVIGDHVWIGTKVTCLKGAVVPCHNIVGACALITNKFEESNCALAGVPAKIVKRGIDWSISRIPVGEVAADYTPLAVEE